MHRVEQRLGRLGKGLVIVAMGNSDEKSPQKIWVLRSENWWCVAASQANGEGIVKETHYTLVRLFYAENEADLSLTPTLHTPSPFQNRDHCLRPLFWFPKRQFLLMWNIFTIVLLLYFPVSRLFDLVWFYFSSRRHY